MKRIALDYLAPRRRTRWPGLALLGASLAVAAALGIGYELQQCYVPRCGLLHRAHKGAPG